MSAVTLPYIPTPFADEVLGSWLSRCAHLNGAGAWKALLVEAGLGRKLQSPMFNLVDFEPQFEALLQSLGTTYEIALRDLTTAPFWCTFSGSSSVKIPGTHAMPMPATTSGQPANSMLRLGHRLGLGAGLETWYCPICIDEDFRREGQTYWRRSHQIPTMLYCPLHWVSLRNSCPSCGAISGRKGKGILPIPSLRCQCGFDLRTGKKKGAPVSDAYKRLCVLGAESLATKNIYWSVGSVRKFTLKKLEEFVASSGLSISRVVEAEFPGCIVENQRVTLAPAGANRKTCLGKLHRSYSAPSLALVLALLEIPLAKAVESFEELERQGQGDFGIKMRRTYKTNLDVPSARMQFLEGVSNGNRNVLYGAAYWYLRINDERWLQHQPQAQFRHNGFLQKMPSIADDQKQILAWLSNDEISFKRFSNNPALIRARIRDRDWLDSLETPRVSQRWSGHKDQVRVQSLEIRTTLSRMLEKEERPIRITIGDLASRSGLTYLQAMTRINADDDLRCALHEANRTKNNRLLIWAARELEKEGVVLKTTLIFKRAGLPSTPDTLGLVRGLVEEAYALLTRNLIYITPTENPKEKYELAWARALERKNYPSDISREQFDQIHNLLASTRRRTCPRKFHLYDIICAILYVLATDCAWRALPNDFPPHAMVHHYFRIWSTTRAPDNSTVLERALVVSGNDKTHAQWRQLLDDLLHRGRKNSHSWKRPALAVDR